MKSNPIIIDNGKSNQLTKLQYTEKNFDENWIQEIIYQNPNLLPTSEIEPVFGNQISIGREISTNAGFIDNLFINSDGYITLVETKLWRNPEARREVVAQIIDYAKELNKWDFQKLDNSVRVSSQKYNQTNEGIIEILSKYDTIDEKELIDNAEKNLRKGRFLLLIVGDGIRENVQDMVEYLSQMPQLYFTLALVELQIFKTEIENREIRLIIPNIITRTKEITRAIIRIEGVNPEQIKVEVPENNLQEKTLRTSNAKRNTITEQDFFENLSAKVDKMSVDFTRKILHDCQIKGLFIEWGQGSFIVKYYKPELSSLKFSLFVVTTNGQIYSGWIGGTLIKANIDNSFSIQIVHETAKLFDNIAIDSKLNWSRNAKVSELQGVYDKFIELVDKHTNYIEAELMKKYY
ncbi:MAG TPA: hypothetical protein DCQ31_13370 [Bacteroidales bacterium]|nr:hypothetical protein [Bacteroidales bacterium]